MKINTKIISDLDPCKDRFDNYLNHYPNFDGNLSDFLSLENITYEDKVWVVTRLMNTQQLRVWAGSCALSVLDIFEREYPNDLRPRKALKALETYLLNPSEENKLKAKNAAAAYYAAYAAAAYAAYAAYYAAYYAACYAATHAVYATAAAYAYAVTAAAADAASNREEQQDLNLLLLVDVVEGF